MPTLSARPSPRSHLRARHARPCPRHSLPRSTAPYGHRRQQEGTRDVSSQTPGPAPVSAPRPHGPRSADEIAIATALTTTWALVTGRRPRPAPLLHDLPALDLIDFWADDHLETRPETLSGPREQAPHDPRISPARSHVA